MKFLELINQKPITEIRLCDKYIHRNPSEIAIKYNRVKFQIKTVIAIIFSAFCILGAMNQLKEEQSEYFFIIVIVVGLILLYFIFHNLIRALNNNPILVINDCGVKINDRPTLYWVSINSIHIKENNTEESIDYMLCIESEQYKWEEDFTSFNLRMDEISHWFAYFKQKQLEKKR